MQDIETVVGFEFPTLDFIMCVQCACAFPETLRKAVADVTGRDDPETYLRLAQEQFALRENDSVVYLLNCDLPQCQKPLATSDVKGVHLCCVCGKPADGRDGCACVCPGCEKR